LYTEPFELVIVLVFSYLASMSGVVCIVCPFADDEKLKNIHVDLALLV